MAMTSHLRQPKLPGANAGGLRHLSAYEQHDLSKYIERNRTNYKIRNMGDKRCLIDRSTDETVYFSRVKNKSNRFKFSPPPLRPSLLHFPLDIVSVMNQYN